MSATRAGFGVGLVSAALITTEIVLTRIFSVIVWYHFAFFAISIALLGLGAAGLAVHAFQHKLGADRTADLLAKSALVLAASLVVVDLSLLHVPANWFGTGETSAAMQWTPRLAALFALSATPFFCGGVAVSLALERWAADVHRIYAWDLAGAGAACALVVPLLALLGGPLALLAPALLAAGAALVWAPNRQLRRAAFAAATLVTLLGVAAGASGLLEVRHAKGLSLDLVKPEYNRWNSFSLVTVVPPIGFVGWGLSPAYRGPVPEQKMLVIDLNAMTTLTRFRGDARELAHLGFDLVSFVYHVKPNAERVCVVGAGGGKDVLSALAAGAERVTAVEINPLIVDGVVRGKFRDFVGNLYNRPDVEAVVADGRSYATRDAATWDVIQLSMVDTSAATAAGAYALTENGLYTREAFVGFLRSLRRSGILSVASVSLPDLAVGARLASTAHAALRDIGADPARSLVVLETPWVIGTDATLYDVLVTPAGFDEQTLQHIEQIATRLAFGITYLPGRPFQARNREQQWIHTLVSAKTETDTNAELAKLPLDLRAPTDDRPFFFYQNRLRDLGPALLASSPSHLFGNGLFILSKVALISLVFAALLIAIPLVLRRRELASGRGGVFADIGYVACLGLGFMMLEIGLIVRLAVHLGDPTATLSVVLFVLLVAGGVGSLRIAPRVPLRTVLSGVVVYALLLAVLLDPLLRATHGTPAAARVVLAALLIAPLGLLLGAPLPAAFARIAARAPGRIPWLYGVNAGTSVLGSIGATLVALHGGVSVALSVGAALYALALAVSLGVVPRAPRARARRPT